MDFVEGFIVIAFHSLFLYFDVSEYLDNSDQREVD